MLSMADDGLVVVGFDVSKRELMAGVLEWSATEPVTTRLGSDEGSVRRFVNQFPDRSRLRVCYEAGPTGFELYRLLERLGVACEVVAPSLIPTRSGDRVKTDRRDARRLARLYRAGELTPIRVPDRVQESVRDLCRARGDLVDNRKRARQQLSAMLLRHGYWYPGSAWTAQHDQWLASLRFDQPALTDALAHYRACLTALEQSIAAVEADLAVYYDTGPYADTVHRLGGYRGIAHLGGLTMAVEVGDWGRFSTAPQFMGFVGLVPSESSTGASTRRGSLTKTGNRHLRTFLVEAAWGYQHRPGIGAELKRRHQGLDPATLARAWKAQLRLTRRWRQLAARKHHKGKVAAAVARELAGFCWAEMTANPAPKPWEPPS